MLKNFRKPSTNVHYYVVLSLFFVEFVLQIVLLLLSASSSRFTSALNNTEKIRNVKQNFYFVNICLFMEDVYQRKSSE